MTAENPDHRPLTQMELDGIELEEQFQKITETYFGIKYRHYRQQVLMDLIGEMSGVDISQKGVEAIQDVIRMVMNSRNYLPEGKDFY